MPRTVYHTDTLLNSYQAQAMYTLRLYYEKAAIVLCGNAPRILNTKAAHTATYPVPTGSAKLCRGATSKTITKPLTWLYLRMQNIPI